MVIERVQDWEKIKSLFFVCRRRRYKISHKVRSHLIQLGLIFPSIDITSCCIIHVISTTFAKIQDSRLWVGEEKPQAFVILQLFNPKSNEAHKNKIKMKKKNLFN